MLAAIQHSSPPQQSMNTTWDMPLKVTGVVAPMPSRTLHSSFSSSAIFCPMPVRTSSPTVTNLKRTSSKPKKSLTSAEAETAARLEIQQILQAPKPAAAVSATGELLSIPRPSINRALFFSTPSIIDPNTSITSGPPLAHIPSMPTTNENDVNMDMHDEDITIFESDPVGGETGPRTSSYSTARGTSGVAYGASHHGLGQAGHVVDGSSGGLLLVHSQSPVHSILSERGLAVTPPMRATNPIPLNSPFDYNIATEGAEIGLLSFSPPLDNQSITQLVDNPARRTQQAQYRNSLASSPNSDYTQKRRFGDTGTRRPRRGSMSMSSFEDGRL